MTIYSAEFLFCISIPFLTKYFIRHITKWDSFVSLQPCTTLNMAVLLFAYIHSHTWHKRVSFPNSDLVVIVKIIESTDSALIFWLSTRRAEEHIVRRDKNILAWPPERREIHVSILNYFYLGMSYTTKWSTLYNNVHTMYFSLGPAQFGNRWTI